MYSGAKSSSPSTWIITELCIEIAFSSDSNNEGVNLPAGFLAFNTSSKRYTNVEKFLEDYARGQIKWHIAVLKLNIVMIILSVKV